ncbi:hypothetical protein K505DRAFT_320997 [Melanomma pulvis-pyrius CBS 109.77]|uniref:Uncharacterized protein n=1 Tax=Melanomma pulvis-pyrius CBS 109.77 TaxID=1314802 RepID=A0A6A6XT81_9PLEO|nr:hypothetical protein K505DRAFT_320997 [Melanomma pulvis-pyrius CBS 109.77]
MWATRALASIHSPRSDYPIPVRIMGLYRVRYLFISLVYPIFLYPSLRGLYVGYIIRWSFHQYFSRRDF